MQQNSKIPKIIHYVWLGNNPKSQTVKSCIDSWKKYCPDYQIKEWNEESIKGIDCAFLAEALSTKHWAFASDYIRLYALYHEGGFYFDTDLEITAPIDQFLDHRFICSFEKENYPSTAFLGAVQNDSLIKALLSYYESRHFIINGKPDTIANPHVFFHTIRKTHPELKRIKDASQQLDLGDGHIIYPDNYFVRKVDGKSNFAIHHFEASWKPPKDTTIFETILKMGPLEIIKSHSRSKAVFPPKLDPALRSILAFTYKKRRRIYVALRLHEHQS